MASLGSTVDVPGPLPLLCAELPCAPECRLLFQLYLSSVSHSPEVPAGSCGQQNPPFSSHCTKGRAPHYPKTSLTPSCFPLTPGVQWEPPRHPEPTLPGPHVPLLH